MSKVQMGPETQVYPMPVLLVGAVVDGKPNFITIASHGIPSLTPPMVCIAVRHQRYTLKGIRQNLAFSVNIPSVDLVAEADYCGIVSGAKVNKVEVCKFNLFYGKLGDLPLIEQCPINLECKVLHILNLGSHSLVIGQVEETHISESCLSEGKIDADKINAFCYMGGSSRQYQPVGKVIAKAYGIGEKLKSGE